MGAVANAQLTSLQRNIARWESAASRTVPGERYQLLLAHLYARSGSGELALGAGSDLDTLLTALAHLGVTAQRSCELRDLVLRSTNVDGGQLLALLADPTRQLVIEALRDPWHFDVELINRLGASVSDLDRQISRVPFVRLQLLLAPVVEVCLRLHDAEPPLERLGALRCEAYLLAGRIAFETRDDVAARRWYHRAVAAAGDPTRRATARTSYALTMLHSRGHAAARTMVDDDPTTGRPIRARLVSLRADRDEFLDRDFSRLNPVKALQSLRANFSRRREVCLQAKRWTHTVQVDAVRDLFGAMDHERATRES